MGLHKNNTKMRNICILYCNINDIIIDNLFNSYIDKMPNIILEKISSYKNPHNKTQSIIGYYLLLKGILCLNLDEKELFNIRISAYGKPYIVTDTFFFNISHSKDLVACIISNISSVGIDVEYKEEIDYKKLNIYTKKEKNIVDKKTCNSIIFYNIWTRKEAITKCLGCGLSTNLKSIDVTNENMNLFNLPYHLYSTSLLDNYICSYVIPQKYDELKLVKVK